MIILVLLSEINQSEQVMAVTLSRSPTDSVDERSSGCLFCSLVPTVLATAQAQQIFVKWMRRCSSCTSYSEVFRLPWKTSAEDWMGFLCHKEQMLSIALAIKYYLFFNCFLPILEITSHSS